MCWELIYLVWNRSHWLASQCYLSCIHTLHMKWALFKYKKKKSTAWNGSGRRNVASCVACYQMLTHSTWRYAKENLCLSNPPTKWKLFYSRICENVNCWKIFHSLCHYLFINTILICVCVCVCEFMFKFVPHRNIWQIPCTYVPYNKLNRQFIDFIGNIAIE